jgi:hypothetical protein
MQLLLFTLPFHLCRNRSFNVVQLVLQIVHDVLDGA